MEVVNPATNERIETYEDDSAEEVETALEQATDAFSDWRDVPMRQRQELLESAGEVLGVRKREWAELMTREMGKPITQKSAKSKSAPDPSRDRTVLGSCEWLAELTDYRMVELDQIAWWHFADLTERHTATTPDK